ncbi:hypothetical protein JW905_15105, partial [bacterium]|nr:hypothetical protein [candidate division CSSED10-310 bacterium]
MDQSERRVSHYPALLLLVMAACFFTARLRYDAHNYYEPVRSLVLDRDLNTYDERAYVTEPFWHGVETPELFSSSGVFVGFMSHPRFTARGYSFTFFPVGWTLLMAPAVNVIHAAVLLARALGIEVAADGYSYPYILGASLMALLYGALGLGLAYRLLIRFFEPTAALFGMAAAITTYNVVPCLATDGLYAHAHSLFLISLFFLLWDDVRRSGDAVQAFVLGLVGGLAAVTRYQDISLLVLPVLDVLLLLRRGPDRRKRLGAFFAFLAGTLPCLVLQGTLWKIVHGAFFLDRTLMGTGDIPTFDILKPHLLEMLFSNQHGLFNWTPLLVVAVVGFIPLIRAQPRMGCYVVVTFAVQTYYNSCRSEWWNLGFGIRRYANYAVLFALGFAALYEFCRRSWLRALLTVLTVLAAIWNVTFMAQFYDGDTINDHGSYFTRIVGTVAPYGQYEYRPAYPPPEEILAVMTSGVQSLAARGDVFKALGDLFEQSSKRRLAKVLVLVSGLVGATFLGFAVAFGRGYLIGRHPAQVLLALAPLGLAGWLAIGSLEAGSRLAVMPHRDGRCRTQSLALSPGHRFVGFNRAIVMPAEARELATFPRRSVSGLQVVIHSTVREMRPRDDAAVTLVLRDGETEVRRQVFTWGEVWAALDEPLVVPGW